MARTDNRRAPISCEGLPATRNQALAVGSKYFYNKPCRKGHVAPRTAAKGECIECKRDHDREYNLANPGKAVERATKWAKENRERKREIAQNWVDNNRDKSRKNNSESRKRSLQRDPDRIRAVKRKIQNNRRSLQMAAEGSASVEDIARIRSMQRDKCGCCGKKLRGKGHIDHIIPLSKGGSNFPRNLQFLCEYCNVSKRDMDSIDFMKKNGRLI